MGIDLHHGRHNVRVSVLRRSGRGPVIMRLSKVNGKLNSRPQTNHVGRPVKMVVGAVLTG
jgi:hypothetical protein